MSTTERVQFSLGPRTATGTVVDRDQDVTAAGVQEHVTVDVDDGGELTVDAADVEPA